MSDNTNMVDLPWHDGTTRVVPEWTLYQTELGTMLTARDGGYSHGSRSETTPVRWFYPHRKASAAVRIFIEAPEPPVKAAPEPPLPELPTSTGAIIAEFLGGKATHWSVRLDHDGVWRSEGIVFSEHKLRQMLKDGYAVVVFEGQGTPAPESGE